jgi:hypothetical protein
VLGSSSPTWGEGWLGEKRKKHLERLSTISLVAALSVSLISLVRTNELSGHVIGSLGDEAQEADTKARTAITDSSIALSHAKDALTKAGTAETFLGKAEGEAKNAQMEASNALTLASGARKEADSFEGEILAAKNNLATLQSLVSARHIIDPRPLEQLKQLNGKSVVILSQVGDEESREFCLSISSALQSHAGMDTRITGCGAAEGAASSACVFVTGPDSSMCESLAKALRAATGAMVLAPPIDPKNPFDRLRIFVGAKNPFWIGK